MIGSDGLVEPLISVIVPIYKVEKYLRKCIDSILAQDYKNLEILLVDDGSPDNCPKICDEYAQMDTRIKVIHKPNGGVSDARNVGLNVMRGEYVAFVDADDYVDINYIRVMYELVVRYGTKMSILPMITEREDGHSYSMFKHKMQEGRLTSEQALEDILYQIHFENNVFCKLYHRSLFSKIWYPKNKVYAEDLATIYKLLDLCLEGIAGSCEYVPYHYVQHYSSAMNSAFSREKMYLIEVAQKILDFVSQKYPAIRQAAIRRYVYSNFHLLNRAYMYPEYQNEVKQMKQNILLYRNSILKNPKVERKFKFAVLLLSLGLPIYCFIWNRYTRLMNNG